MKSFDPDEEFGPPDEGELPGRQIDDDVIAIDDTQIQALLHRITSALPGGGEDRDGQRQMSAAIGAALSHRRHLVVEAGTGVGKSLAYLAPLALSHRRVVVATATKNLQDQLALKDAPRVADALPGLNVAVLKGKNNYFCHLRGREMGGGGQQSFDDEAELPTDLVSQVRRILDWAQDSNTGERDSLTFEVDERAWRQLSATPHECVGVAQCPFGDVCFHERAKTQAAASDIVIVNHALYAAHLATGGNILPPHSVVVFDEAHEVHDTMASLLGTTLTATEIRGVVSTLRGYLGAPLRHEANPLSDAADDFAAALGIQFATEQIEGMSEGLTVAIDAVSSCATTLVGLIKEPAPTSEQEMHRIRAAQALTSLVTKAERFHKAGGDELVWLSEDRGEYELHLSLLSVGAILEENLWNDVRGICTSATIPTTLRQTLGLPSDGTDVMNVPSPFDYPNHGMLYVAKNLPDRRDDDAYYPQMLEELIALMSAAGGRTLSLFTNRTHMLRTAKDVEKHIKTPLLVQGTQSRQRLMEIFRDDETSSLFALNSFWQGVDVPGRSLSLVTIDRLPFRQPTDPVDKARRERLGDRGFAEIDLPRAAMMLAQGIGRLIRSQEDRGVVAVMDNRLATATYRRQILEKLPPMRRSVERTEVEEFLRHIVQ